MLRAREPKLLNAERALRMIDAASYDEVARYLTDCGYEDMSGMDADAICAALNEHREKIFSEIDRLSPDGDITDVFRMKYDCHNAKVVLKAEAMGINADNLMSSSGRIAPKELADLYREEKYSSMPGMLGAALEKGKEVLARTSNPQQTDFAVDRTYFEEMQKAVDESGSDFLKGYVRILIDTANLKSAVRTLRMGKNTEFLRDAVISGGNVSEDRILNAGDGESIMSLFASSLLADAAALGSEAVSGGRLTEFELACDNAVNAYLKKAKLVSFGNEPVLAYLASVENEITAVRMILTGKLAGIKSEMLRERLRDMYA